MDDSRLEHEIVANKRTLYHDDFGAITLHRPTPREEREISEARRKSYHEDLKNPDVLTKKQIAKNLAERGVWTEEDTKNMQEASGQSSELMAKLTALGFTTGEKLIDELLDLRANLFAEFPEDENDAERTAVRESIERFFDISDPGSEDFLTEVLFLRSMSTGTHVDDLLARAEMLMHITKLVSEFAEVKMKFNEYAREYAMYFAGSAEARADRYEALAKLYYCTKNEDGKPLWDNIDEIWDEDPDKIAWLNTQMFYFENGITDEHAEVLERYGFTERAGTSSDKSESSPEVQKSNSDGDFQESEPQSLSAVDTLTS